VLGFAAAIGTVWWTLTSEARKAKRERNEEVLSLRHALGAEIRQIAHRALEAHHECEAVAARGEFTLLQIENAVRFPEPIIYPAVAGKLGLLGDGAYQTVFFFACISMVKDGVDRMRRSTVQRFGPQNAIDLAGALLLTSSAAEPLLPQLRASAEDEKPDASFANKLA
jgi:hypothetical protein